MSLISIVTVVLNDANGFARTRMSILEQSMPEAEWIVIDGGSSDDTVRVILESQDRIAWWVSEPDGGIYEGMNKGVARCTGDFVMFMNAGDTFAGPGVLRMLFGLLACRKDVDVVLGGTMQAFGSALVYRAPKPMNWLSHGLPAFHQSTLYRRALIQADPYDVSYRLLADYAWLAARSRAGLQVGYLDAPVSRFEVGGRSYSQTRRKFRELARVKAGILGIGAIRAHFDAVLGACSSLMASRWPGMWRWGMRLAGAGQLPSCPSGKATFENYFWRGAWEVSHG